MRWLGKRSGRWLLAGALAALGAGTFGVVQMTSAAPNGTPAALVPITPCRLFDTRAGSDNIGPRANPLGPGESFTATVWGVNGRCNIPTTATAVALNVTFVNPTADSVLTVYPADAPLPTASNLNWVKGQAPTPNAVTVALSAQGQLAFWNLFGDVDVIADISGYYQPTSGGIQGPKGDKGDKGDPGAQGPSGATRASARISKALAASPGAAGVVSVKQGTGGDGQICVELTFDPTGAVIVANADNFGDGTNLAAGRYTQVEPNSSVPKATAVCGAGNWIVFVTGFIDTSTTPGTFAQTNEPFTFIVA